MVFLYLVAKFVVNIIFLIFDDRIKLFCVLYDFIVGLV